MRIKVKPRTGMIVRHPTPPYRALSEKGEFVPRNQYWGRRLKDGDAVLVTEPTGRRQAIPASTKKASDKREKE